MDCLIIKKKFLDKILRGEKTWEIRGSKTTKKGIIGLIESGSGKVIATANLVQCHGPFSVEDLKKHNDKTQIENEFNITYSKIYAWELSDVKPLNTPQPYKHPQGAIIWVKVEM